MQSTLLQQLRPAGRAAGQALLVSVSLLVPGASQAETAVGSAAAVNTAAFGAAPGAVRKAKLIGDNVVHNERIDTSESGLVQVLLKDGSTFTVGPNSDLVIDEFVYNPADGSGKLVASFSKGVARFVGGKLSKNKGGVSVKTPVGTIGIRGGIANINMTGNNPVFSLVFGEELTFSGNNGTSRRIYQPGYSLEVNSSGGSGGGIRRTTGDDLNGVQSGLTGNSGQNGGASSPPTGNQVQRSGVTRLNSGLGQVNTVPPRKPQTGGQGRQGNGESDLAQIPRASRQQTETLINRRNAGGEATVNIRLVTAGATFSPAWNGSVVATEPGAQGLIGGSTGLKTNRAFTFDDIDEVDDRDVSEGATRVAKATIEGNKVTQFLFPGSGSYYYSQTRTSEGVTIHATSGTQVPVSPVAATGEGSAVSHAFGVQYFNEDFLAFAHLPDVTPGGSPAFDIEDMVFGIHGTGTDFAAFGAASDPLMVRTYDLASDPTTLFSLGSNDINGGFLVQKSEALFVNPLIAGELGSSFLDAIASTGFKLIEDDPATLDGSHYLASSFQISGTGQAQKSLISLAVGGVDLAENSSSVVGTARRGSHRLAASETAALYGGPLGGAGGPGGSEFFGSNAESFVFGNDMSGSAVNDPYSDGYVERPAAFTEGQTLSATLHVAKFNEDLETAVSSLTRTDRTLAGYASGVLESTVNFAGSAGPVHFISEDYRDVSITFDSANDTLGGALTVYDSQEADPEVDAYTVRFGFNSSATGTSRGTFIDDDTYAARDSNTQSETYLTTDTNQTLQQHPDENANTYLVPDTLVSAADNAIMNSVASPCTCAFLEWGYWGTSMNYDDTGSVLTSSTERRDNFHLGTWVAGDVTATGTLPTTGSATYTGQAVGNVTDTGARYLAAGDFSLSVNFADRAGTATISNFDGRTFGGNVNEQAIGSGNFFSGTLSGDASGTIGTSIVGGPNSNHDGVIGSFSAIDGTWSASGIVAGAR